MIAEQRQIMSPVDTLDPTGERARLTALHRAGIAVARQLDLTDVTTAIVCELGETLGYHFVSVYLWDGTILRLQAQRGYATPAEAIPRARGVIGRVFRTGASARVIDPAVDADFFYADHNVRSQIAVPVTDRERVCGVVSVESATLLDAGDYELLELFAQQIGIAIGNARLHEALVQAAWTDPLTGTLNRAALLNGIAGALAAAAGSERPQALLFVDVDHFKALNDRYGHQGGDRILQWCAAQMQALLPVGGLLGRYGGEEFVMLVREHAPDAALLLAERLRERIAGAAITDVRTGETVCVTVSVGIACSPRDGTNSDALLHAADAALYRAKGRGRNRVEETRASGGSGDAFGR